MSGSLLTLFDDFRRKAEMFQQNDCTEEFLKYVINQESCRISWKESVGECKRLKLELDYAIVKLSEFEKKLQTARVLLDGEKKRALKAEQQRDELQEQCGQIYDILSSVRRAGDKLANETKETLDKFLITTHNKMRPSGDFTNYRLDTIDEINSTGKKRRQERILISESTRSPTWSNCTGSLLSDISCSRSEDNLDLEVSLSERGNFKKPRRSLSPTREGAPASKKRRSARIQSRVDKVQKTTSDHLIATTTVTVPKQGPVTACSTIKTYPDGSRDVLTPSAPPKTSSDTESDVSEPVRNVFHSSPNLYSSSRLFSRPHCFKNKTILKPSEECSVCLKKMSFGSKMFYCPDCRVAGHADCRDKVPLPCVAFVETPRGNASYTISDYCSKTAPMIPPLVVRCVMEVEARGLNEVGIYRVSGSEREVKSLKERLLRGKGVCSLSSYDVHVICSTIKDFLKTLSEPLVTYSLWPEFIRASEQSAHSDRTYVYYQVLSQLPQPNRDTLAFMMHHLQKVSRSPECKMSKSNLATVFGPTIVGYSNSELRASELYSENAKIVQVVENFLEIPGEYWANFLNEVPDVKTSCATPVGSMRLRSKRTPKVRKVFNTPPVVK